MAGRSAEYYLSESSDHHLAGLCHREDWVAGMMGDVER